MITLLSRLAEGRPHGGCNSSDQARGPLAFDAGSDTQAQRGCAHQYLLPSVPCAYPLVWPWSGGPGLAILDGHHTFYKVGARLEHLARFVAWVNSGPRSPTRTATFVALATGHI